MVHLVIEAVERLRLDRFAVREHGGGSAQYPPHMMLALLIYCYANGIFASRRIERATYRDLCVRYLCGELHPDHDTICAFRRENLAAISAAFVSVLELAREMGVLKVGNVAVDGTKIRASANRDRNVTYKRAKELRAQLREEVGQLLLQAEAADQQSPEQADPQGLPEEVSRLQSLREKMDRAIKTLEVREEQSQQRKYERKKRKRARKDPRGAQPAPPPPDPPVDDDAQANLTDADSRVMPDRRSRWLQGYNAQIAVDATEAEPGPDGEIRAASALIIGTRVSTNPVDAGQLAETLAAIPEEIAAPPVAGLEAERTIQTVSADAGYLDKLDIAELQEDKKLDLYIATGRREGAAGTGRKHDFRPCNEPNKPARQVKDPLLISMEQKLQSDEGKELYAVRNRSVERVFGTIKQALGFRQLRLRGTEGASIEWELASIAYNIKKLARMRLPFRVPGSKPFSPQILSSSRAFPLLRLSPKIIPSPTSS